MISSPYLVEPAKTLNLSVTSSELRISVTTLRMANVDDILRGAGSAQAQYWKLDGFATDLPPRIYIFPILPNTPYPPPYHLSCLLSPNSKTTRTLIRAADVKNSEVSNSEIEQIGKSIVSRLDNWAEETSLVPILTTLPMGSNFILDENPREIASTWLSPNYELQRRYLGVSRLKQLWHPLDVPPTIDLEDLQSLSRIHDSVSLVILPNKETAIFKGAIKIVARMYHELRELLRIPDHPNVISSPKYIVTREVNGLLEPAVCGFILEYHSGGTMFQKLADSGQLPLSVKVKWTRQLLSAMMHVTGPGGSFYSDLKLDNILLSKEGNLVLTDFEQFGAKDQWLHPMLWASTESKPRSHDGQWKNSPINPLCMPRSIYYSNPPMGYWKSFINATKREQEGFEAYSFAKVIWCIFEEATNEHTRATLSPEELRATNVSDSRLLYTVFPYFEKTPQALRYWIWLCTKQSPEWGAVMCDCGGEVSEVCGKTGARLEVDIIHSHAAPSILDTHHYFEGWVTDQWLALDSLKGLQAT